jgi:hypothetical protein
MTEAEWLECTDPERMLAFLESKVSSRKRRLFGCACVRRVWRLLRDSRSHKAVEVAEQFADELADESQLARAYEAAMQLWGRERGLLLAAVSAAWRVTLLRRDEFGDAAEKASRRAAEAEGWTAPAPRPAQVSLLRDIFGNPFRPRVLDPSWRTPTVTALARAAYEERGLPAGSLDCDRLAILTDALEDAGCDSADILSHLRGPGPHVRGCWVLDLLLGKQ